MIADSWKDYEIIAAGGGEKLERWGGVYLLRPDPQAIWDAPFKLKDYPKRPLCPRLGRRRQMGDLPRFSGRMDGGMAAA